MPNFCFGLRGECGGSAVPAKPFGLRSGSGSCQPERLADGFIPLLGALRAAREQRLGHNPLAHLRREAYGRGARVGYPAGTFRGSRDTASDRTVEENNAAIREVIQQSPYLGR